MSFDRWLKKPGGLWLPRAGFARSRWMWSCFGCGCGMDFQFCNDFYTGDLPAAVWVDIPNMADNGCAACETTAETFYLDYSSGCLHTYIDQLPICGGGNYRRGVQCQLIADIPTQQWKLRVTYSEINNVFPFDVRFSVSWETAWASGTFSEYNHILDHLSSYGVCDGAGTTCTVYE